jgi:hypothetical protein
MLWTQVFLKDIENQLVIFLKENFDFSKTVIRRGFIFSCMVHLNKNDIIS